MLQFTDTVTLTKLVRERCIRRVLTLYTSWRKENADLRHGPLKGTEPITPLRFLTVLRALPLVKLAKISAGMLIVCLSALGHSVHASCINPRPPRIRSR
jgi:hypothetical protein